MTSPSSLFLACRLFIHSYFHHHNICSFSLRLYVFISYYTTMLKFCSLYVLHLFPDSSTFPFKLFFLECMYFFSLFVQATYLSCIVGKSPPFSITLELLVSWNIPIFRGYAFFLAVMAHTIFTFKIYREMQSYPASNEPIYLQNCQVLYVIYLVYSFLFTITIPLSGWCPP